MGPEADAAVTELTISMYLIRWGGWCVTKRIVFSPWVYLEEPVCAHLNREPGNHLLSYTYATVQFFFWQKGHWQTWLMVPMLFSDDRDQANSLVFLCYFRWCIELQAWVPSWIDLYCVTGMRDWLQFWDGLHGLVLLPFRWGLGSASCESGRSLISYEFIWGHSADSYFPLPCVPKRCMNTQRRECRPVTAPVWALEGHFLCLACWISWRSSWAQLSSSTNP